MSDETAVIRVPRDETGKLDLLVLRPLAWEYLLFGHYLLAGLARNDAKWRDHQLGFTLSVGPSIDDASLRSVVSELVSRVQSIARNVEVVLSKRATELAFGAVGTPGDPEMIEHVAGRTIVLYEALLDWHSEVIAMRLEDRDSKIPGILAGVVQQPIAAVREFVATYVAQLEQALERHARNESHDINLTLGLEFDLDDRFIDDLNRELARRDRKRR